MATLIKGCDNGSPLWSEAAKASNDSPPRNPVRRMVTAWPLDEGRVVTSLVTVLSVLSALFFAVFSLPSTGWAQINISELTIHADDMVKEKDKIHIKGNVKAISGSRYLSCEEAIVFIEEERIVAYGNVHLQDIQAHVKADKVDLFYKKKVGTFYNALIQSGPAVFEGAVIHQVGKDEYKIVQAKYSTCVGCPKLWNLRGGEVAAQIGGYARIHHFQLQILNIPILWLPIFWIPLKTKRQSGLLAPSIQQSSHLGWAFELNHFWAISKSQDMTLSARIYERKGLKGLMEYRQVFNKDSRAYFKSGLTKDPVFRQDHPSYKGAQKMWNRGFFAYNHYYKLSQGWIQRASLGYMSDLTYNRDFLEDFLTNTYLSEGGMETNMFELGQPSLANFISLTKNTSHQSLNLEGTYHVNLLQEGVEIDNEPAVHRLPEIHYSVVEQELGQSGLMWNLDMRYTRLTRKGFDYDDVCDNISCLDGKTVQWQGINFDDSRLVERRIDSQRDGHFDPSQDLIRTGQRLIVNPSFNYPIFLWGDRVRWVPSLTYSHMLYHFDPTSSDPSYQQHARQGYLEAEMEFRTQLSRVFGRTSEEEEEEEEEEEKEESGDSDSSNARQPLDAAATSPQQTPNKKSTAKQYKHEIEPFLSYVNTPLQYQSSHNFFNDPRMTLEEFNVLTDFDFLGDRGVQFDYYDQFFTKNLVRIGLINRLVQRKWHLGQLNYSDLVYLKVQQDYDFSQVRRNGTSSPWQPLKSLLSFQWENVEFHAISSYFHYLKTTRTSLRLHLKSLTHPTERFLELSYLFDPKIEGNNNSYFSNRNEIASIGLGLANKYLTFAGGFSYSLKENEIQFWDLRTLFKFPGDCLSLQVLLRQLPGSNDIRSAYSLLFNFN